MVLTMTQEVPTWFVLLFNYCTSFLCVIGICTKMEEHTQFINHLWPWLTFILYVILHMPLRSTLYICPHSELLLILWKYNGSLIKFPVIIKCTILEYFPPLSLNMSLGTHQCIIQKDKLIDVIHIFVIIGNPTKSHIIIIYYLISSTEQSDVNHIWIFTRNPYMQVSVLSVRIVTHAYSPWIMIASAGILEYWFCAHFVLYSSNSYPMSNHPIQGSGSYILNRTSCILSGLGPFLKPYLINDFSALSSHVICCIHELIFDNLWINLLKFVEVLPIVFTFNTSCYLKLYVSCLAYSLVPVAGSVTSP